MRAQFRLPSYDYVFDVFKMNNVIRTLHGQLVYIATSLSYHVMRSRCKYFKAILSTINGFGT